MNKQVKQFQTIFSTKTPLTKQRVDSLHHILKALFLNPYSLQFRQPLDWQERGLINYSLIIQKPMDLSTVELNLERSLYHNTEECLDDIQLIFQNSWCYNKGTFWIVDLTDRCQNAFRKLVRNYLPEVKFKVNPESKKTLKKNKADQKSEIHSIIESQKKKDVQRTKKEQPNDESSTLTVNTLKEENIDEAEMSKLRQQLFDLIYQASQRSLQVLYLIVKKEDLRAIETDRNGNCSIDVKKLSKSLIEDLKMFLKEEVKKQRYDELKEEKRKRKQKIINEKSRYDI